MQARQDLQFLNAQKLGDHEAEIEKIKSMFLSILRDIKADIDSGEQPSETATAAILQTMQEAVKDHEQEPLSMNDVTDMLVGQIGQFAPMDEETTDLFRQLMKKMMEQASKETNGKYLRWIQRFPADRLFQRDFIVWQLCGTDK